MGAEPVVELLAGELAHQHHGVSNRPIGAVRVGHAVQGNGNLVQVLLPVNAGGIHKLLVLGHALRRLQVLVHEGADGPDVDVQDTVGLGKQACGLGRSLGAQEDSAREQQDDSGDNEQRSSGASGHLILTVGLNGRQDYGITPGVLRCGTVWRRCVSTASRAPAPDLRRDGPRRR